MKQFVRQLHVETRGTGLSEVTRPVLDWASGLDIETGMLTVYIRHTSASLTIQENADPDVVHDLERFFARLVPEDNRLYQHTMEGPDDMPAHIRTALTQTHLANARNLAGDLSLRAPPPPPSADACAARDRPVGLPRCACLDGVLRPFPSWAGYR